MIEVVATPSRAPTSQIPVFDVAMKGKFRLVDFPPLGAKCLQYYDSCSHVQTRQPLVTTLESFCFPDHFTRWPGPRSSLGETADGDCREPILSPGLLTQRFRAAGSTSARNASRMLMDRASLLVFNNGSEPGELTPRVLARPGYGLRSSLTRLVNPLHEIPKRGLEIGSPEAGRTVNRGSSNAAHRTLADQPFHVD